MVVSDWPEEGRDAEAHSVHKGSCDQGIEARVGRQLRCSTELPVFISRLAMNGLSIGDPRAGGRQSADRRPRTLAGLDQTAFLAARNIVSSFPSQSRACTILALWSSAFRISALVILEITSQLSPST